MRALRKAVSTSSGPDSGDVAYTSPVDGSTMSSVRPSAAATALPSTMLWKVSTALSSYFVVVPAVSPDSRFAR